MASKRDFKEVIQAFEQWQREIDPPLSGNNMALIKACFASGWAMALRKYDAGLADIRAESDEELIMHDREEQRLEEEIRHLQLCFNLSRAELPDWVDASKVKPEDLPRLVGMMTQHQKMADKLNTALASNLGECRKMLAEQQHKLDELQRVVRIMWNQG